MSRGSQSLPAVMVAAGCLAGIAFLASCRSDPWASVVDVIPPESLTGGALTETYIRTQMYWNEHGRVPERMDQLPERENHTNALKDGWGYTLNWESNGVNEVRAWSLGRDGKPGGEGSDADVGIVFVGKYWGQDELVETIKPFPVPEAGKTARPPLSSR
ncbi:MAG: type II secretion system protein GspG [Pirellulales bacterium]